MSADALPHVVSNGDSVLVTIAAIVTLAGLVLSLWAWTGDAPIAGLVFFVIGVVVGTLLFAAGSHVTPLQFWPGMVEHARAWLNAPA